ncbi:MAG: AI-2E family transporter [Candidatus Limnocylindrales bacterium]|nr:AI-2E family transporter [Candidatus Limnocylindrales bacterium]
MSEPPPPLNERQQRWLTSFLVLGSTAFGLVVLSYLAAYWVYFGDVILTFFLAWLLAFILSSPVRLLLRAVPRLPRVVAVVAVYAVLTIVLLALVVILAQALFSSLLEFIRNVPSLRQELPTILQPWSNRLAGLGFGQVDLVAQANAFLDGLASTAQDLVGPLQQAAVASIGVVGNVLIVFILSVFIVIDSESILNFLLRLVPPRYADEARLLEHAIGRSFGGFLRGQAIIGFLYAVIAFAVSELLGLPYVPVITATAGVLMAIPFFGPFVSWVPPVLVAFVSLPDATLTALVGMGIGWFVVMNVVQPRVMADAVGIPPIVVLASVLIGSKVAGIPGAIFAIPIAAVISAVFMYSLRRSLTDQGSVAVRAARRLEAREGRHVRVPREPDPAADTSPE